MINQHNIKTKLKTLIKYSRRIIVIGFAVIIAYTFLSGLTSDNTSAVSEVQVYSPERQKLLNDIKNYENLSSDEQEVVDIKRSIACKLNGTFCNVEGVVTEQDFMNSYAFKIGQFIAYPLAQMPSSTSVVVHQSLSNAGLVPNVYAQTGIGYNSLLPFLSIWKQIRNVAYVLVTILLIVSAFFIMFRSNSDSQNSISLENYLPKIIVVMIFIEFSYAIAGFLIDLMYISIMFIFLIFDPIIANKSYSYSAVLFEHMLGSPIVLFDALVGGFGGFTNILLHGSRDILFIFGKPIGFLIGFIIDSIIIDKLLGGGLTHGTLMTLARYIAGATAAGGPVGILAGFMVLAGAFLAPLILITIVMILALAYYTWKIILTAVKAYIMIVMLAIFSPAIIFMGLLPNSKYGFGSWVRSFISNLVVFPVIYIAIFLITVVSAALRNSNSNPTGANLELPFMPTINTGFFFLIGIAILSLLPKMIESVQNAISQALLPSPENEILRDKDAAIALWRRAGDMRKKTPPLKGTYGNFKGMLGRIGRVLPTWR